MECKYEGGTYMENRKYIDPFTAKVKSNRHARFRKQRRKDIRLINESKGYPYVCDWSKTYSEYTLPDALSYISECGRKLPARNAYPKRYYRARSSIEIRKTCNRKFRRRNADLKGKSNDYRRCTEFWWEYD